MRSSLTRRRSRGWKEKKSAGEFATKKGGGWGEKGTRPRTD